MSKIKLSKTELAALDLLIAEMSGSHEEAAAPIDVKFTPAVARVTATAVRVTARATPYVARATPYVADAIGVRGGSVSKPQGSALFEAELSLDQLIQLRKEANSNE